MKFKCECTVLQKAIQVVQRAAAVKTTLSILECVKMEVKEDKVILKANNLEMAIEYWLDSEVEETGEVLVNVKIFSEIVRKMQSGTVSITGKDNIIEISCNNSLFNIKGLDADSFPEIPKITESECFEIEQDKLGKLIKSTLFSVSQETSRPIMTGLYIGIADGFVTMVGIDSYRMAVKKEPVDDQYLNLSAVVPGKTMSELSRVLENQEEKLKIHITKKQVQFLFENFKLVSRLLEGEFLDYKGIVPREFGTVFKMDKQSLEQSVDRTLIVIPNEEKKYPIDISTENNVMNIKISTHVGEVYEKIPVEVIGENIDVAFNPKFFTDCLRVIEDEEILIKCNTEVGPCIISPVEGDDYIYLIGAVRK